MVVVWSQLRHICAECKCFRAQNFILHTKTTWPPAALRRRGRGAPPPPSRRWFPPLAVLNAGETPALPQSCLAGTARPRILAAQPSAAPWTKRPPASSRTRSPPASNGQSFARPSGLEKAVSDMKIFSHQSAAYAELLLRAQTFFAGNWRNLPIKARWHSLILGPTGTGKSTLGTLLAEATGAALCRINIAGYMPSGAHNRAVAETISIIIDHIHRHSKSILFFEEIEKIWHDTSWNAYIRGEL